jgi:hypothetical protein
MPMNRRELVTTAAAFGGAALLATKTEGQAPEGQPAKPEKARGKIMAYGEGGTSYFELSEMPKGIKIFYIDQRYADRIGRLLLAAAANGWEIEAAYTPSVNGPGLVYDVRAKMIRAVRAD